MVKLNNIQIEEIKKLINKSVKVSDIAKQYNVSTTAIYNIKKNIPEEIKEEPNESKSDSNSENNSNSETSESSDSNNNSNQSIKKKPVSKINKEDSESSENNESNNSYSKNSENSETSESNESDKQNIKINNNNSMLEFINNDDEDKQPDIIIDDITVKKSNREKINNIMEKMNLNNNNNKLDQSIQSIQSIKPIINSKLMVSDEYKQKRSLILSIRSYLDLFFETKEGLRILLNMNDKKDLVLFNSKQYDYSVIELQKLKDNILFEINLKQNSNMIIELSKNQCMGYEKIMCSVGINIESFKDSLYRDPLFIDNLKQISCEYDFSDILSPEKSIILAIVKQTFLLYKLNKIKMTLSKENNDINNNLSELNKL